MHDHRERQGPVEPDEGSKNPIGSVAFYLLLGVVAVLLWQAFIGGAGPC